ncbi:MAG: tRNA-intron lyase [Candidatus Micrarchaeia archaeon]
MAYLLENFVIEEDPKMIKMLKERGYGTLDKEQRLILSPCEALYLLENKRIMVKSKNKKVEFKDLMKEFRKKEKDIDIKYAVYSDLRNKGYVLKTGYKFGIHLRVYEKGIRPGEGKSSFLIEVFSDKELISFLEIRRLLRIAQITKKSLILAIVNESMKIDYMKINSIKL